MEYFKHRKCESAIVSLFYLLVISECVVLNSRQTENTHNNTSNILFLTPFVENYQLAEAKSASEVTNLPGIANEFTSYSGYFTVNATYNSNMFFWFFPPLNGNPDCPVLLWLEGGPGVPGLNGLFDENGPIQVDANGRPSLRNYTWNREFAVLYIDSPVGTGFSFTDDDLGYARNEDDISKNLYSALTQFFLVFSEYRNNPFFISGLSYACKYVVILANLIDKLNHLPGSSKINLKGISIAGGFCTLRLEDNYADYLFQLGLIDQIHWRNFTAQQNELNRLIDRKQYSNAFDVADRLILGFTRQSNLHNVTGIGIMNSLGDPVDYEGLFHYLPYIERPETRRAIHVGTRPFYNETRVFEILESDLPQGVSPAIESILNLNYPTLFYNGNMDILTSPASVENLLTHLEWKGTSKFAQATQHIYRINNDTVAGYVRQADNLYYMVVRNAGHIVPFDQPLVALDIITRFVRAIIACSNCDN